MNENAGMSGLPSWVGDEFAGRFKEVLGSMCGSTPDVDWAETGQSEGVPPDAGAAWILYQSLTAAENAGIFVQAPLESWNEIGSDILRAAGLDGPQDEDIRSTYLEAVGQVLSAVWRTIGAHLGREVEFKALAEASFDPHGIPAGSIVVRLAGRSLPPITIAFSETLAGILFQAAPASSTSSAVDHSKASDRRLEQAQERENPSETIDLLLEVELPVGVSFGRTQLALRDVIKLSTGSIVELNRTITEPVEVIVNNCVIARGEVVVVEGNYGVRIREIVSPEERLRSLY